jgi:hypothetical protein
LKAGKTSDITLKPIEDLASLIAALGVSQG